MNNAEVIWNYLISKGLTQTGAAGLMGNLRAESGLNPMNLQNSYNRKLNITDEDYTMLIDNGNYPDFIMDKAGYGLAQWTFWSRKKALLEYAQRTHKSIGDLEMQLDFLWSELSEGYKGVLAVLKDYTKGIRECSDAVLLNFERPADQSETVRRQRALYAQEFYNQFAGSINTATVPVETSLKIEVVNFGTSKSNPRTEKVEKITIHHMAGDLGAVACAEMHLKGSREASANYYIGSDGIICRGVPENRRAWTSSNAWNDQRAITIEVANNAKAPSWSISSAAYLSLINLCADICKRYGITPKYDGTKNGTLTEHRMFAATECPGAFLHEKLQLHVIEEDVASVMKNGSVHIAPTGTQKVSGAPNYLIGKVYTLQVELKVRETPNGRIKTHAELTADGQKHDIDNDGALDKGTRVTCKALEKVGDDIWMQAPSGWLAAYYRGNVYIK